MPGKKKGGHDEIPQYDPEWYKRLSDGAPLETIEEGHFEKPPRVLEGGNPC